VEKFNIPINIVVCACGLHANRIAGRHSVVIKVFLPCFH